MSLLVSPFGDKNNFPVSWNLISSVNLGTDQTCFDEEYVADINEYISSYTRYPKNEHPTSKNQYSLDKIAGIKFTLKKGGFVRILFNHNDYQYSGIRNGRYIRWLNLEIGKTLYGQTNNVSGYRSEIRLLDYPWSGTVSHEPTVLVPYAFKKLSNPGYTDLQIEPDMGWGDKMPFGERVARDLNRFFTYAKPIAPIANTTGFNNELSIGNCVYYEIPICANSEFEFVIKAAIDPDIPSDANAWINIGEYAITLDVYSYND